MQIKINFGKKHLYFLVGFLVLIGAILLVKAVIPNPGHPVNEIDLSQDFSIDGSVTFNKLIKSWNVMGWSLAGLCFSDAKSTLGASFPGYFYSGPALPGSKDATAHYPAGHATPSRIQKSCAQNPERCRYGSWRYRRHVPKPDKGRAQLPPAL